MRCGQVERFPVQPGQLGFEVAAGNALQQAALRPVGGGAGGFHRQPAVAAPGAEQDAGGLADLLQRNRLLRVALVGYAGDELVPECADLFFHVRLRG